MNVFWLLVLGSIWGSSYLLIKIAVVSTVTYINAINGLIRGALVLGEALTVSLAVSLGLVLLGVLLVRR